MNIELKPRQKSATLEKERTKSKTLMSSLVEAIVNGDIPPGTKISEPELAKQYQVSRGPLREAMMRLEGLGLIERIPHVGARVITFSPEKLIELYS
ncbi:GntR family transcriptional regulator, partial [Vibrio astriarenae]